MTGSDGSGASNDSPTITRAHLKKAAEAKDADLLDTLLEIDASRIDDTRLFTDTWGEWWGLLFQAVVGEWTDGVRVLLKHGADRKLGNWGDCIEYTPREMAEEKNLPEIIALLDGTPRPEYRRASDPSVPPLNDADEAVNRQGDTADATGLVFPTDDSG